MSCGVCFFFFFSSRRRHTRLQGDWSSDVCSSDLPLPFVSPRFVRHKGWLPPLPTWPPNVWSSFPVPPPLLRAEVNGKTGHGRDTFFLGMAMLPRSAEITGLLKAWSGGDQAALDRLAALVYDELHRMARHYMQDERTGNTLQTTALVNEVYLRLVDVRNVDW